MRRPAPFFAFCALLLASAAFAQAEQPRQGQQASGPRSRTPTIVATPLGLAIAGFDSDGDRLVSRAEYDAGVARSFAHGDGDADGFLGLLEFTAWSEATLGSPGTLPGLFDFDGDADDRISRTEFEVLFTARLQGMDGDRDGLLARSELVTAVSVPVLRDRRRRSLHWSEEREEQRRRR